jgi:8-oxo-dGTP diphosphatase
MSERPKVGVGVLIRKNGKVLLGKRKNAHGAGDWCPPGGHLEYGESFEECAKREVKEETGLTIQNIRFGAVMNDIFEKEQKHYVTINMIAEAVDGEEVRLMEPDKFERWEWFSWDQLPEPLFLSDRNLLKQGFDPFR